MVPDILNCWCCKRPVEGTYEITEEDQDLYERCHRSRKIYDEATLHTTKGDITIKLFGEEAPRTVENFCGHCKSGYYDGCTFHKVVRELLVQTGDPTGTGEGGESIWGCDFDDEFSISLKHNKPYTVSMANTGPNTNRSQFFITVSPAPWLDFKHTVFGRVTKGQNVVKEISKLNTIPVTNVPWKLVKIRFVTLK